MDIKSYTGSHSLLVLVNGNEIVCRIIILITTVTKVTNIIIIIIVTIVNIVIQLKWFSIECRNDFSGQSQ